MDFGGNHALEGVRYTTQTRVPGSTALGSVDYLGGRSETLRCGGRGAPKTGGCTVVTAVTLLCFTLKPTAPQLFAGHYTVWSGDIDLSVYVASGAALGGLR